MADYTVEYQILVDSTQALESIQSFQKSVGALTGLQENFKQLSHSIGKVNTALATIHNKDWQLKFDTQAATTKVTNFRTLLKELQTDANIKLRVDTGFLSGKGNRSFAGAIRAKMDEAYSHLRTKLSQSKTEVQTFNNTSIKPIASVEGAIKELERLDKELAKIKRHSSIVITPAVGPAKEAAKGQPGTQTAPGAVVRQPKARISSKTGGVGLYPSTAQVLGPTYANTGGSMMGEMVKGMGVAYGLGAIMSGVTTIFKDATDYMNISQTTANILGTHDKRFDFEQRFEETSRMMRQVGMDTRYTAPEVAAAGKFLAMAGYNVDDIQKSIRPITDIALVGDTDLGSTADVVTNIMTSYELDPGRMSNAADILTMTFTKTNTTLMELAESFKYAGTIANQTGLSFEETAAAFGILGNAGIKGTQAGTTLRMMLLNMLNPTKKQKAAWESAGVSINDGNGNIRNLSDILADLNKVSQTMSNYDFTSLIGRMFRVTAAPGALALINDAQGVREVMELNHRSAGLSSNLALSKQNTTAGLWAQFTSAFTEAGMKGFESMENGINAFLRKIIRMMKSPEFVEGMGSAMNMFLKLAGNLVDVSSTVISLWNKVPDTMKNGLVVFAKWQMYGNLLTGVIQSFRSTAKLFKGILFGQTLLGPIRNILAFSLSTVRTFRKTHGILNGIVAVTKLWGRQLKKTLMIAEVSSGQALAGKHTSIWTNYMKPLLKMAWKYKWWISGGTAVAGVIGTVVYQWIKIRNAANAAREAGENWFRSLQKMNTDAMDPNDPNTTWLATWETANNKLLTHEQKLTHILELYDKIHNAKTNTPPDLEDSTPFVETDAVGSKEFGSLMGFGNLWFSSSKPYQKIASQLGTVVMNGKTPMLKVGDSFSPLYKVGLGDDPVMLPDPNNPQQKIPFYLSNKAKSALSHGAIAGNHNNKILSSFRLSAINRLMSAADKKDFDMVYSQLERQIEDWDTTKRSDAGWTTSGWKKETEEQVFQHPASVGVLQDNAYQILQNMQSWGNIIRDVENNQIVSPSRIQNLLATRFAFFDTAKYGVFGTDGWTKSVSKALKDNNMDAKGDASLVITAWTDLLNLFQMLPKKLQFLLYPYLNRTPYQSLLTEDFNLPEGGYQGGKDGGKLLGTNKTEFVWGYPLNDKGKPNENAPKFWYTSQGRPVMLDSDGHIIFGTFGDKATVPGGNGSPGESDINDQDFGRNRYSSTTTAPKQVIVRIENLMNVENVDLSDERKAAVVSNLKEEMAQALVEVVSSFSNDFHE